MTAPKTTILASLNRLFCDFSLMSALSIAADMDPLKIIANKPTMKPAMAAHLTSPNIIENKSPPNGNAGSTSIISCTSMLSLAAAGIIIIQKIITKAYIFNMNYLITLWYIIVMYGNLRIFNHTNKFICIIVIMNLI